MNVSLMKPDDKCDCIRFKFMITKYTCDIPNEFIDLLE